MVYAEFGGQTECIMGNSKIENGTLMKFNNIVSYSLNNYYWLLFEKKTLLSS